ncbi:MAG: hypothetical protein ABSG93_08575 [Solirubrobacteraceae bacterium]|jgi:hypothetical protein
MARITGWNWWLPKMPARLLCVEPSPAPRPAARKPASEGVL